MQLNQSVHLLVLGAMVVLFTKDVVAAPAAPHGIEDRVWHESFAKLNDFLTNDIQSDDEELNMRLATDFYNDKYRSIAIANSRPMMMALETFIALPSIVGDDREKSCSEASKLVANENIRGLGRRGQQRRIDRVVNYYVQKHAQLCQKKSLKRVRTSKFRI